MSKLALTRHSVEDLTLRVLRPGERARPDVRLIDLAGRHCVVKDYGVGATVFKRLLGAYLVWRERVAMERAAGIEGIPEVVGTIGTCALVTQYMPGREATSAPREQLDETFFTRLRVLIDRVHARGVVHGDLKKLENVLVTADGQPVLVDFATAFISGSNPIAAVVFPRNCDDDIRAVYKLKQRCAPHLLTEGEQRFLEERGSIERAFRYVRRYVRYAVKRYSTPEPDRGSVRLK